MKAVRLTFVLRRENKNIETFVKVIRLFYLEVIGEKNVQGNLIICSLTLNTHPKSKINKYINIYMKQR